jgi:hypothetical protein
MTTEAHAVVVEEPHREEQEMRTLWIGVLITALGAVGCATDGRQAIPDYGQFEHASEGRHITFFWNCVRTESGALRVEGVALNRWEPTPLRFLEITLFQVDPQGRVVAQSREVVRVGNLLQGFPEAFRFEIAEQRGETRVDLVYQYQYVDDSFDRLSRRLPSFVTDHVRDACRSEAHRNRSRNAGRIVGDPSKHTMSAIRDWTG